MDINLTGPLAEALVENLKQSSYTPLISSGAAIIVGLMTGIFTLFGLRVANKYTENREKRNHTEELLKTEQDEIKLIYKERALKKSELYSQICGLKGELKYNFEKYISNSIEYERYLLYMDAANIEYDTTEKDFKEACMLNYKLKLYSDVMDKYEDGKKQSESNLLNCYRILEEKLGLLLMIWEKDDEELKKQIASVEALNIKTTDAYIKLTEIVRDPEYERTKEQIDTKINCAYDKVFVKHLSEVYNVLNGLQSFLENKIKNETPWWQIQETGVR